MNIKSLFKRKPQTLFDELYSRKNDPLVVRPFMRALRKYNKFLDASYQHERFIKDSAEVRKMLAEFDFLELVIDEKEIAKQYIDIDSYYAHNLVEYFHHDYCISFFLVPEKMWHQVQQAITICESVNSRNSVISFPGAMEITYSL